MEDNLNKLDNVELSMLLKLADSPDFGVLKKLHRVILDEMKELNFNEVPTSDEGRVLQAKRIGHRMAWKLDEDLKRIVDNFISLKSKYGEKKTNATFKKGRPS